MSVGPSQFGEFVELIRTELLSLKTSIQDHLRAAREAEETANQTRKEIPARLAELRIPAEERAKNDAYRDKAHRQQVWLTWGTWLAFIAAAVYAGIAARQLHELRRTNNLTQQALGKSDSALSETLDKMQAQVDATHALASHADDQVTALRRSADAAENANRPYIGISGIDVFFIKSNGDQTTTPQPDSVAMRFKVGVKNFGPVPGTDTRISWRFWFGGRELHADTLDMIQRPENLFPGKTILKTGESGGRDYIDMMNGSKKLVWELAEQYEGPKGKYAECTREEFGPREGVFFDLGKCVGKP
jgi:hypothetical protein